MGERAHAVRGGQMIQWAEWKWTFDELRVLREAQLKVLLDAEARTGMYVIKVAVERLRRRYHAAEHAGVTEGEIRAVLTAEPFVNSDPRRQPALNGLAMARKRLIDAVTRVTKTGLTGQQVTLLLRLKRFGGTIDD